MIKDHLTSGSGAGEFGWDGINRRKEKRWYLPAQTVQAGRTSVGRNAPRDQEPKFAVELSCELGCEFRLQQHDLHAQRIAEAWEKLRSHNSCGDPLRGDIDHASELLVDPKVAYPQDDEQEKLDALLAEVTQLVGAINKLEVEIAHANRNLDAFAKKLFRIAMHCRRSTAVGAQPVKVVINAH